MTILDFGFWILDYLNFGFWIFGKSPCPEMPERVELI
jgi:hypothetical protein